MALDLTWPATSASVLSQREFHAAPFPEAGRVGRRGDELGAGQIEVALARPLPILDGGLTKAQELPNLSAVVFDRAPRPLVARVQVGGGR